MKAIIQTGYGSPDNFELRKLEKPEIKDSEVLVKVHSCSINAGDVYVMRGVPRMVKITAGMPKPKMYIPGYDLAGIVEKVGRKVTRFQPGDEVYGGAQKTFAEYVSVQEKNLSMKPGKLSFNQAAALPTAAITALLGIKNAGKVKEGQKVLINGASGGVGTFAVQIAKALGAEVTGVCSTRHKDMLLSIGADHIIDYTQNDFTKGSVSYDLILDQVANHSLSACRSVLAPKGKHIPNSGNAGLAYILKATVSSMFYRNQGRAYFAAPKKEDFDYLNELIEDGKVLPVIDRVYSLEDTTKAFRYMEEVHASGKVVINVQR
jgi:NADPH:quinone reductase-like Zn-dependent oxidoreductase